VADLIRADVAVIGAGPAGIAAACRATESGGRVLLLDENPSPGGQIWRGAFDELPSEARPWIQRLQESTCEVWPATSVVDADPDGMLLTERNGEACRIRAGRLVIATGAREMFLPFPGWTLPNVLGIGAAQVLSKTGFDFEAKRIVLAGSGPLILPVAAALKKAGARLALVAEQAPLPRILKFALGLWRQPVKLTEAARYRSSWLGTRYRTGTWVVSARGDERVTEVEMSDGRRRWTEPCDFLLCSYGLIPNLELARLLGCEVQKFQVRVDELQRTSLPNILCAGEPTGIGGRELALVEGEIAGLQSCGHNVPGALQQRARRLGRLVDQLQDAFRLRGELLERVAPDTLVCRCEDVPWRAVQGAAGPREAKIHTRAGMGPCQGRICGPGLARLCGWSEQDTVRPPLRPCLASTLACIASGDDE